MLNTPISLLFLSSKKLSVFCLSSKNISFTLFSFSISFFGISILYFFAFFAFKLTATVRSVSSETVGAIGSGFTTPPSIKTLFPIFLGVKIVGIAIEARIASKRSPQSF